MLRFHSTDSQRDRLSCFSGDRRDHFSSSCIIYVRIEQYDSTDTFSYMDYIKMNSVFSMAGMFFDERYHYTAMLGHQCRIFQHSYGLVWRLFKRMWIILFITSIYHRFLEFQELRLRNVVSASATDRVTQSLSILCMDLCKEQDTFISMSMKELAKLGATTRETVNQVLKTKRRRSVGYEHKNWHLRIKITLWDILTEASPIIWLAFSNILHGKTFSDHIPNIK